MMVEWIRIQWLGVQLFLCLVYLTQYLKQCFHCKMDAITAQSNLFFLRESSTKEVVDVKLSQISSFTILPCRTKCSTLSCKTGIIIIALFQFQSACEGV